MATTFEYVSGKARYARLVTPDTRFGEGKWKITVYFEKDSPSINKVREWIKDGLRNHLKQDEDGYYMAFSRPTVKDFRGGKQMLTPPEVLDAEGKSLGDKLVGSGSDVTVKLEVYKFISPQKVKGMGARLVSVKVDNLIPYEINRDFAPDQAQAVEGLMDQPKPNF